MLSHRVDITVCISTAFRPVDNGLLQGRTYLCKKLDLGTKVATVRAADLKYYTKTRDFTDVHVVGGHTAYAVKVRLAWILSRYDLPGRCSKPVKGL